MKCLVLATEYPPARGYGLARYAHELSNALSGAGCEAHVVNCNQGERTRRMERVWIHEMRRAAPVRHYEWVGDAIIDNVRLVERAVHAIEARGPFDFILSHDWLAAHAAKSLRSIAGVPWLLAMHDTEVGKRGNRLTRQQVYIAEVERWAVEQADRVVTTSRFMAQELGRVHGFPEEALEVVPCGVRVERFLGRADLADFRGLLARPDEGLILYAGRLSSMKGVEDLAEALVLLRNAGAACRVVFAGEGPLRESLEDRLARQGAAGTGLFAGWVSDKVLGALIRVADAVAVPSRYEPFGLAALEALAMGARVVAADTGGLAEIAADFPDQATLVPPSDPPALAEAMRAVLDGPGRRREDSLDRAPKVPERYTWPDVARKYLSVMNETLRSKDHANALARQGRA